MTEATARTHERDALARLAEARARTDSVFALLDPKALLERPIPERHRLIFYLGHLEAFDWNLVARQACGVEPFDTAFDRLFAFGIDPVDGGLPDEPASDWPAREAIEAYNLRTRSIVDECARGRPLTAEHDATTPFEMAIEHRLMHAETLAYLLHQLPFDNKRAPAALPAPAPARASAGTTSTRPTLSTCPASRSTCTTSRTASSSSSWRPADMRAAGRGRTPTGAGSSANTSATPASGRSAAGPGSGAGCSRCIRCPMMRRCT
jgi:hypothetical protein